MTEKKIRRTLISVFHKEGIEDIVKILDANHVEIISTGGTETFIKDLGINVTSVEQITGFPSILGGRVKTLHPNIFGGILQRQNNESDIIEAKQHEISPIDLIIVDLYPFEETVRNAESHDEIIEKIDIGGISLIRAAAKNYIETLVVSSRDQYSDLMTILSSEACTTDIDTRKRYAVEAFSKSSMYDSLIQNYLSGKDSQSKDVTETILRYGENPHQNGSFSGNLNEVFEQLHGKQLSYNNLIDIDAGINLVAEFQNDICFAILKHNNACGIAVSKSVKEAYSRALAADPLSAFGGILVCNHSIDQSAAEEMNQLFFEIIIAPEYEQSALEILKSKKNRVILKQEQYSPSGSQIRSALNGHLKQDYDSKVETEQDLKFVTNSRPTSNQIDELLFANKIVKHSKSNAIVLAKGNQMLSSGVGQTSRVDAVQQAINKAKHFGFDLQNAVLASDAFFPFSDSLEIAANEGINAVIQPGGSIKDQDVIDYCNENKVAMVLTGIRHFKH